MPSPGQTLQYISSCVSLQGEVMKWTPTDVQHWLVSVGSGEHAYNFEDMTGQVSGTQMFLRSI